MDQKIAVVSTNTTYLASGGTVLIAGLSESEWTVLGIAIGIALGVLTFAVNWYYRHKTFKLIGAKEQQR